VKYRENKIFEEKNISYQSYSFNISAKHQMMGDTHRLNLNTSGGVFKVYFKILPLFIRYSCNMPFLMYYDKTPYGN